MTNNELRDEIKSFIVAGHETTATWCTWAIYALGKYQDIQEKVYRNSVKRTYARNHSSSLTQEVVKYTDYLWAFLQEVLRLYPSVGILVRFTNQIEYWKGYTIPPNTRINIPSFLLHRHPKYWSSDKYKDSVRGRFPSLEFHPERWLSSSSGTIDVQRPPLAFLPLATEPRECIGCVLAEVEAKLIIASIVQNFCVK